MCDRFSMSSSVEFRNPFLDRRLYDHINQLKNIETKKKYPIVNILKQNGLLNKKYNKIFNQSPQKQIMKKKSIIKILKNIINDYEFIETINFIKFKNVLKKIDENQMLAWQIINIYYFFHTFKNIIIQKDLKKKIKN